MRVLGYGFCMSVHSQSTEITVSNVSDRAYNRALFRVFPLWRGLLCHLGWLFQNKIYSSGNTYPLLQQENNSIPVICKGVPGANEDFSLFSWTFCFCRNVTLSPYFTSVSKLFLWTLYLLFTFLNLSLILNCWHPCSHCFGSSGCILLCGCWWW